MIKTLLLSSVVASAAALGCLVQPALGQPEPVSIHVSYADLDLATDAGAATMLARLESAATKVCEWHRQGKYGAEAWARFQACRRTTVAQSIEQVGAPRLAALYAGRAGVRLAQTSGSH